MSRSLFSSDTCTGAPKGVGVGVGVGVSVIEGGVGNVVDPDGEADGEGTSADRCATLLVQAARPDTTAAPPNRRNDRRVRQ
jgi:hypothetical protein